MLNYFSSFRLILACFAPERTAWSSTPQNSLRWSASTLHLVARDFKLSTSHVLRVKSSVIALLRNTFLVLLAHDLILCTLQFRSRQKNTPAEYVFSHKIKTHQDTLQNKHTASYHSTATSSHDGGSFHIHNMPATTWKKKRVTPGSTKSKIPVASPKSKKSYLLRSQWKGNCAQACCTSFLNNHCDSTSPSTIAVGSFACWCTNTPATGVAAVPVSKAVRQHLWVQLHEPMDPNFNLCLKSMRIFLMLLECFFKKMTKSNLSETSPRNRCCPIH